MFSADVQVRELSADRRGEGALLGFGGRHLGGRDERDGHETAATLVIPGSPPGGRFVARVSRGDIFHATLGRPGSLEG